MFTGTIQMKSLHYVKTVPLEGVGNSGDDTSHAESKSRDDRATESMSVIISLTTGTWCVRGVAAAGMGSLLGGVFAGILRKGSVGREGHVGALQGQVSIGIAMFRREGRVPGRVDHPAR